jgi:hypothetical protein
MPSRKKLNEMRDQAAERYKPEHIRLLLVAETPPVTQPSDPPRYFYFEAVSKHDGLFRGVVRAVLKVEPDRASKARLLDRLRERGVFLIDLKPDPSDPRPFSDFVPSLIERCRALRPERIILIKANVFDEAFAALKAANLPVVNVRVPFPGSGRQAEFAQQFAKAMRKRPRRTTPPKLIHEPPATDGDTIEVPSAAPGAVETSASGA